MKGALINCAISSSSLSCASSSSPTSTPGDPYGGYNCEENGQPLISVTPVNDVLFIFETPRHNPGENQSNPQYYANMDCIIFFRGPPGWHLFVEEPVCLLEQGNGSTCDEGKDHLSIPINDTANQVVHTFYQCCPPGYSGTDTHMNNITVHFKSNAQVESFGIMGYIAAYPVDNSGRRKSKWKDDQ